jgi:colanic acid/amylovoran biosynthesis glycosyltransferase
VKKRITVYQYRYLPLSQTFIYRQLKGLSRFYELGLITHCVENREEFPGFDPLVIPPNTLRSRLTRRDDMFFDRYLASSSLFHVNFGNIAIRFQRYARKAGIPMTAYFLGVDASEFLKNPIYRYRLRRSKFAAVFVNSEDMKRRLLPFLPAGMKCLVVYCGIPLEMFSFKSRSSVHAGATFLQVSRLESKKGVDISLKAFSRYIKEADPHAKLIIAGDGPLRTDLQLLASKLGLDDHVIFTGYVGYKKYIELLQSSDVFLHPSVTSATGDMEGIPNTICEAMACGLPVISTRHSGIPEVIEDGVSGYLAEERDVEGLYERMVLLSKTDIASVSMKGRAVIEMKFDHDKTTALLAEYMDRIISGRDV